MERMMRYRLVLSAVMTVTLVICVAAIGFALR